MRILPDDGLVDDQHRARIPAGGAGTDPIEFGRDRRCILESVGPQVLHDLVGPGHANKPVSGRHRQLDRPWHTPGQLGKAR
jgi:hypothetical protein